MVYRNKSSVKINFSSNENNLSFTIYFYNSRNKLFLVSMCLQKKNNIKAKIFIINILIFFIINFYSGWVKAKYDILVNLTFDWRQNYSELNKRDMY